MVDDEPCGQPSGAAANPVERVFHHCRFQRNRNRKQIILNFRTVKDSYHEHVTTEIEKAAGTNGKTVKYVYFFGDGHAEGNGKMKDVLGGKGAGLAEMTNAGLPVPPGFTIQTEACREYMRSGAVSAEVNRADGRGASPRWKNCRARSWAGATIRCWSASAPARSSPCRA